MQRAAAEADFRFQHIHLITCREILDPLVYSGCAFDKSLPHDYVTVRFLTNFVLCLLMVNRSRLQLSVTVATAKVPWLAPDRTCLFRFENECAYH